MRRSADPQEEGAGLMAVEDYNWADRLVHKLAFGTKDRKSVV